MTYTCDTQLKLSNPDFGLELNRNEYDYDEAKDCPFPDVATLTKLANETYNKGDYTPPKYWKLLTKAYNETPGNGYCGVAFWNPKLCQVVVAHRGTSNFGGIITCLDLIFNASNIKQAASAATFVYIISRYIKGKNSESGPSFQLSITGHSLGGWLAQISAVTVEYCEVEKGVFVKGKNYSTNIHAHTVSIDNPGCKDEIIKLLKSLNLPEKAYDDLDAIICVAKPNIVNTIKDHIGQIYELPLDTHKILDFINHFDPFGFIRTQCNNLNKSVSTSKSVAFRNMGFLSFSLRTLKWNPQNSEKYFLNVFNKEQKRFVITLHETTVKHPSIAQKILDNFEIPPFQVEGKMIKGNNVIKTIARIKLIPSIEDVTQAMLRECAEEDCLKRIGSHQPNQKESSSFIQKFYVSLQAGWRLLLLR